MSSQSISVQTLLELQNSNLQPMPLNIPFASISPLFAQTSSSSSSSNLNSPAGTASSSTELQRPGRYSKNGKKIGRPRGTTKTKRSNIDEIENVSSSDTVFQCEWKNCKLEFYKDKHFFKHVDEAHLKNADYDIFPCEWKNCAHPPFNESYQLVIHMRQHTLEKPYHCKVPDCNKQYSRLENLKTHERTHTGEKPYLCKFDGCTRAFTNASDCSKHQNRVHSDKKPYECKYPTCEKRYTDPSSLRKHIKVHHLDYNEKTKYLIETVTSEKSNERRGSEQIENTPLPNPELSNPPTPIAPLQNPFPLLTLPPQIPVFYNNPPAFPIDPINNLAMLFPVAQMPLAPLLTQQILTAYYNNLANL